MKSNNAVSATRPISPMINWLGIFYLVCDFGDKVTYEFTSMCDSYFDTLWLHLPVDLQKYFILAILNAETPVYLEGFGVHSTRETFKKVN